ncbi:outer membrane protein [Vibrio gallicus]|uniref:outer membrane protein n=1 Tax=Vibrio gallicus TaxID=190897 RepID=UPI0021C260D6|nr:porin family protein [Vibrio gallicus]
MKKYNLVALCGLALLSSSAFASSDPSGFYLLGGLGSTGIEDGGFTDDTAQSGNWQNPGTYHDAELEGKGSTQLYSMGYQINRIVGVEATYMDYGNINANLQENKQHYSNKLFDPYSLSVSANLGYTFHNGLRPFAKVGLSYINLGQKDLIDGPIKDSDQIGGLHLGVGVEYALDLGENHGNLLFRTGLEGDVFTAEIQDANSSYAVDDDYAWSIATLYAGVGYRF